MAEKVNFFVTIKKENHLYRWFIFFRAGTGMIRRQSPVLRHGLTPHPYGLIATR